MPTPYFFPQNQSFSLATNKRLSLDTVFNYNGINKKFLFSNSVSPFEINRFSERVMYLPQQRWIIPNPQRLEEQCVAEHFIKVIDKRFLSECFSKAEMTLLCQWESPKTIETEHASAIEIFMLRHSAVLIHNCNT